MQCEMCGQDVPFTRKMKVEGTPMEVCSKCARFGEESKEKRAEKSVTSPIVSQRLERRKSKTIYRDVFESNDTGEVLVPDFAKRITDARNSKRITKKELAARINEKLSVVHNLERGELHPDDKLIRKIERELGISLREKMSDVKVEKRAYSQGVTLGDLINLKQG